MLMNTHEFFVKLYAIMWDSYTDNSSILFYDIRDLNIVVGDSKLQSVDGRANKLEFYLENGITFDDYKKISIEDLKVIREYISLHLELNSICDDMYEHYEMESESVDFDPMCDTVYQDMVDDKNDLIDAITAFEDSRKNM